jgi:group I intron endonuclease
LQRAWEKYGEERFEFEILEQIDDPKSLVPAEQRWIDALQPVYNVAPTAGSQLGFKHAPETLPKLGAAWVGRQHTPEERAKIGAAHQGRPKSTEQRAKQSAAMQGKNKGVGWSEEKRAVMTAVQTSPDTNSGSALVV